MFLQDITIKVQEVLDDKLMPYGGTEGKESLEQRLKDEIVDHAEASIGYGQAYYPAVHYAVLLRLVDKLPMVELSKSFSGVEKNLRISEGGKLEHFAELNLLTNADKDVLKVCQVRKPDLTLEEVTENIDKAVDTVWKKVISEYTKGGKGSPPQEL